MRNMGEITFALSPKDRGALHLSVGVNVHDNGDTFDVVCRYSPMPGETYEYVISSTFQLSVVPSDGDELPMFQVEDSVMLRGTLAGQRSSPVLHRVSNDVDRISENFNKLSSELHWKREGFKALLASHITTLEKDDGDLHLSIRDRDFYQVMEILGLALMGTHHPDEEVRKMAEYVLGALFPETPDL